MYKLKLIFSLFIFLFISTLSFSQIQNESYRLDSIAFVNCSLEGDDCEANLAFAFDQRGDTLISKKRRENTGGKLIHSEMFFVFNEDENLTYKARVFESHKEEERYTYRDSLLERIEIQKEFKTGSKKNNIHLCGYENDLLKQVTMIDLMKNDTIKQFIERDQLGRIIYYGGEKEPGKYTPGVNFEYDGKSIKPIRRAEKPKRLKVTAIQELKYNEFGNIVELSASRIDHRNQDENIPTHKISISYDSHQNIVQSVIDNGRFEIFAFYEYDANGDLILFRTQTIKGEKVVEELKYEIEYDDNIVIPFDHKTFSLVDSPFSSFVNVHSVTYSSFVNIIQQPKLEFVINKMPSKVSVIEKDVLRDSWRQADVYEFYYSKI